MPSFESFGAPGVLLARRSAFQIYAANRLFEQGLVDRVVFEQGDSFVRNGSLLPPWSSIASGIVELVRHPRLAVYRAHRLVHRRRWYGRRHFHNQRILGVADPQLAPGLRVVDIEDVNHLDVSRLGPAGVVLVFGTRLIREEVVEAFGVPVVNLHWGWSPDYRGEGIVSALATEGVRALGITVHLLTPRVDAGPIFRRARPAVDAEDNLYSIGLRLAVIGTRELAVVGKEILRGGTPQGQPQDLSRGRLYSRRVMREHPEYFPRAWRALRRYQQGLVGMAR